MYLKLLIVIMSFFFFLPSSIEATQEEKTDKESVDKKEKENENSKALKKELEKIMLNEISSEVDYLFNSKTLLDLSSLKVEISFDPIASPKLIIDSRILKWLPLFIVSPDIHDPYIGSPAYEGMLIPRKSLNIDPVTGKYYWEW